MNARDANHALDLYISNALRGIPVFHDHFAGRPHGGLVVIFPRDDDELSRLDDPGPLSAWTLRKHALVFSLTPVGFHAQVGFTLENYGKTTLAVLQAEEHQDPRYWWQGGERNVELPAD
jgi:hypothetical protein